MDLNTMENGGGVGLEERMAAPRETHIPLMSVNSTQEKRITEGLERAAPAQTDSNSEKKEQAKKFGSNAYVATTPIVAIAMVVIGSLYLEDCKIQPFIPIYLIVAGGVGILQSLLTICKALFCSEFQGSQIVGGCIGGLTSLFMLGWFIAGCVWVYGVYGQVEYIDTSKNEYCHKTLYLFAFWLLNVAFIVFACVWVYGVYGQVDYIDTTKNEYCHKTLYLFTFWLLNVTFIALGLSIVLIFCGVICITVSLHFAD